MSRAWVVGLLGWLLVGPVPLFAGNESGNGGDVVYCERNGEVSAELLDYFEASVLTPQLAYSMGESELSPIEKALLALNRLRDLDPERAERYETQVRDFEKNVRWVSGVELPDIPDSGYVPIDPTTCRVRQIAIRKKPLSPEHRLYTINKDLYDLLDNDHRAGLMLHEIVYGELFDRGQKNSVKARYFTALISSDFLAGLSQQEYEMRLEIVLEESPLPGDHIEFASDSFDYVIKVDELFQLDLRTLLKSVGNGDLLSWKVLSLPTFATLDGSSLKLSPRREHVGHWTMQVTVQQGEKGAMAVLNVLVVADNSPPLWLQNPIPFSACANQAFSESVAGYVRDPDGDPLMMSKLSGAAWLSMDASGRLSGTPQLSDVGSNTVQVRVTDGFGLTSDTTVIVEVKRCTVK